MKEKLFNILDGDDNSVYGVIYEIGMIVCIILSLTPLTVHQKYLAEYTYLKDLEWFTTFIFIVDYLARWYIADLNLKKLEPRAAYIKYPFTWFAIIDLISILPTILEMHPMFKMFRMTRLLKIVRVLRFIRMSKSIRLVKKAWDNSKETLSVVVLLAIMYVGVASLVIFNVDDPEQFKTFFDAMYWATISLTTVGYGDVTPKTEIGKAVAMLSSVVGCAIIALPSGIITAGYMKALEDEKEGKLED